MTLHDNFAGHVTFHTPLEIVLHQPRAGAPGDQTTSDDHIERKKLKREMIKSKTSLM